MSQVPQNPTHAALWTALLQRKIDHPDTLLTASDFQPLFENYPGGASDFPAALFATDLIHAYPSAKIIITTRDEDAWVESVMRTLVIGHREASAARAEKLARGEELPQVMEERNTLRVLYHQYAWKDDFPTYGRQYWREYHEQVKRVIKELGREKDVIEYNPAEGWGPLCKLIGRDVPHIEFPHEGNKSDWSNEAKMKLGMELLKKAEEEAKAREAAANKE